ncbi:hypothetical protein LSH36_383g01005 [Paralvinella palmiformis]|uniref:Rab-GAP TBC domain-containing protein n=1 Tax=Paralvinella palmiformis TaxID=53620 RepID=A0AAD9JD28_9ANNE|nr:hypothetical protein LSH36_383g01005 [Paralvinella palmiformis]
MANYRTRLYQFENELSRDIIDNKRLRKLVFSGCPSEKSVRSNCWKVLLNYLPLETKEWEESLDRQRKAYHQFVEEMILKPGTKKYDNNRTDVTLEDHPLNPNPDSQWSQFFRDNEMLLQIDKDCRRLCPDLSFFQSATPYPCKELVNSDLMIETLRRRVEQTVLKSQNVCKNRSGITITDFKKNKKTIDDYVVLAEGEEAHWEVVERILFIYVKLNPGQGYVQGMNEIIGPIYYTFASDSNPDCQAHAEADSFWCFTNLMSEIRDNFIKHLDDTVCGIGE